MIWFQSQWRWRTSMQHCINTLTDSIHCIDWLSHLDGVPDTTVLVPNATDLLNWWSARWNCGRLWSSRNLRLSVTYLLWGELPQEDTHPVHTHAYRLFAALQIVIDWEGSCVINGSSGEADCGHFFTPTFPLSAWRGKGERHQLLVVSLCVRAFLCSRPRLFFFSSWKNLIAFCIHI